MLLVVSNLGDEPVNGEAEQVLISDALPPGLVATEMTDPSRTTAKSNVHARPFSARSKAC